MRSLEQVNIRTNERTYVLTYIRTGQTLYPLHNFVVRGDNKAAMNSDASLKCCFIFTFLPRHQDFLLHISSSFSGAG